MNAKAVVLLLFVVLLAGCSNGTPKPTPEPTTGSSTTTTTAVTLPTQAPTNTTGLGGLELTGCTGFTAVSQPIPKQIAPGNPPPGWEPKDPTQPSTAVNVQGAECARLHVGPYERGPIRFVWDGHVKADIPDKCQRSNQTSVLAPSILNQFTINDAEIASYLNAHYAMPTVYADIQTSGQSIGPIVNRTWTWGPPGETPSEIMVQDDGTAQPYSIDDRIWWPWESGIAQLDLTYTRVGSMTADRAAYGTMQPPMLVPPPDGAFVGTGRYFPTMSGEGKFTFFSDRLCEHPAP